MSKMDGHENQNTLEKIAFDNAAQNADSPYFAIFAEDEIGYAIPIENIQEFVLLPTMEEDSFVTIGTEKIPCISLGKSKHSSLGRQAVYMICKNNSGAKIAIIVGGMSDCHRFFVKTLPLLSIGSSEDAQMDTIREGVTVYHTIKSPYYQIDVLSFQ